MPEMKVMCIGPLDAEVKFCQYIGKDRYIAGCVRDNGQSCLCYIFRNGVSTVLSYEYEFPEGSGPPTCICTIGPFFVVCCNAPSGDTIDRIHVFKIKNWIKISKVQSGSVLHCDDMSVYHSCVASSGTSILVSVSNSNRVAIFDFAEFLKHSSDCRAQLDPEMGIKKFNSFVPFKSPLIGLVTVSHNIRSACYACITPELLRIRDFFDMHGDKRIGFEYNYEVRPSLGMQWTHLVASPTGGFYFCSTDRLGGKTTLSCIPGYPYRTIKSVYLPTNEVTDIAVNEKYVVILNKTTGYYFLSTDSLEVVAHPDWPTSSLELHFAPWQPQVMLAVSLDGFVEFGFALDPPPSRFQTIIKWAKIFACAVIALYGLLQALKAISMTLEDFMHSVASPIRVWVTAWSQRQDWVYAQNIATNTVTNTSEINPK